MSRNYPRLRVRAARGRVSALLAAGLALLVLDGQPLAHEGHSHDGEAQPTLGAPGSPRVVATSETYQLVGIVEGEVLVIYLDRAADNAPVTTATLEVTLDGEPLKVEPLAKTGTYEATSPALRKPGGHEVLVTLSEGSLHDLLVGTLVIPAAGSNATDGQRGLWQQAKAPAAYIAGFLLIGGALAMVLRRRSVLAVTAAVVLLALTSVTTWAHEGHDHGPDLGASPGNSPARRPDGSIFVPKPTQRLLEIRTRTVAVESARRTVRFSGRIIANPNRSGVVQSTVQGRYEAPEGGVPALGTRVKAGDLLGRVGPAFASIDSSDMAQTLGNLDQEVALARIKLARQEQLLKSNVVARAAVEDTRIQIEGLEKRRRELLAARARPEELRAPVDGVIASSRVVAGQVVAQSDQLFQIIDPASLLVEALLFDQADPDRIDAATASVGSTGAIKLEFVGRSHALQQQYSILQFRIIHSTAALNVGTPVTVIAATGEPVTGILLPRSALAQAANGQTVVFSQKEPEVFVPRPVRSEPFDSHNVLATGGIAAAEKIVVQGAQLINQVR
jgi:hypothetical protein